MVRSHNHDKFGFEVPHNPILIPVPVLWGRWFWVASASLARESVRGGKHQSQAFSLPTPARPANPTRSVQEFWKPHLWRTKSHVSRRVASTRIWAQHGHLRGQRTRVCTQELRRTSRDGNIWSSFPCKMRDLGPSSLIRHLGSASLHFFWEN